ncbi:Protein of unknown function DUF45 [Thermoplasmatales archaeon BRNA1]|nr:Protein of unknown function DUF45 [Thermoplasmatales archaeon BRNA1]
MGTDDDLRLHRTVQELAGPRGYSVAEARFTRSKELSVRWKTTGSSLYFYVSDYLEDAPRDVLKDFCRGAMTFVFGGRKQFGERYMEYMTSDGFLLSKRPIYLRRSRNLLVNDVGKYHALSDSVQRLYDAGLLEQSDIDNTVFTWTVKPNYTRLGYCSPLMRVVAVSSALDRPDISEHALDYVVYHECMHLRQGYRPFDRRPHDAAFHREMAKFPGLKEAEKEINSVPSRKKRN